MFESDRAEFDGIMRSFGVTFGKRITEDLAETWWEVFRRIPMGPFRETCKNWLQWEETFPVPGKLMKRLEEMRAEGSDERRADRLQRTAERIEERKVMLQQKFMAYLGRVRLSKGLPSEPIEEELQRDQEPDPGPGVAPWRAMPEWMLDGLRPEVREFVTKRRAAVTVEALAAAVGQGG